MYNCIFSGHCIQETCDMSCPILAETTYLLERNNILMSSRVFKNDKIEKYQKLLENNEGKFYAYTSNSTVESAELFTYCSICKYWKGSRLHCVVYNLKFSEYIDAIKNSWSTKFDGEDLEYMKIWSNSAKVLIISSIDYVNFKEFECQTLLKLIQSRSNKDFTTIVVTPPTSNLVGSGNFYPKVKAILGGKGGDFE